MLEDVKQKEKFSDNYVQVTICKKVSSNLMKTHFQLCDFQLLLFDNSLATLVHGTTGRQPTKRCCTEIQMAFPPCCHSIYPPLSDSQELSLQHAAETRCRYNTAFNLCVTFQICKRCNNSERFIDCQANPFHGLSG
jgi:hypothetical protein